jgi:hypothetical protein
MGQVPFEQQDRPVGLVVLSYLSAVVMSMFFFAKNRVLCTRQQMQRLKH